MQGYFSEYTRQFYVLSISGHEFPQCRSARHMLGVEEPIRSGFILDRHELCPEHGLLVLILDMCLSRFRTNLLKKGQFAQDGSGSSSAVALCGN